MDGVDGQHVALPAGVEVVAGGGVDRWCAVGDRLRSLDHDFFLEVLHRVEVCVATREAAEARLKPLSMPASL